MSRKPLHVVPHSNGWAVRRQNANRASSIHPMQKEAIDTVRPRAREDRTEFVIHRPDGRIRDKDSHGHDPVPPKDKK